ncbi:fungal-specific transcription factor domain-containing protein [Echria macrotheca]|uniref:Fungal-specific transcription factor domain-containing protein n=1 Tax=Echria macrotheca TaxID=438768 RepID=A0AAJ0F5P5_9PEZI|nr:fungal-specific transcription factor domain-containing protein [Echria macrotheca]
MDVDRTKAPPVVRGLEKRKACDLCHIKKIRCDTKKPVCGHCVVYGAQCTYTPHIKKRRAEVKVKTSVTTSVQITSTDDHPVNPVAETVSVLPAHSDLIPRLTDYFTHLNSILPLFDPSVLSEIVSDPQSPSLVAAANVILALTYKNRATTLPPLPSFDPETCTKTATRLLDDADTVPSSLLTLQTLLGLLVLQLSSPHRPLHTTALLARSVALAYHLGLHQHQNNTHFDAPTVQTRIRTFWVLYILDHDINTRLSNPPLLRPDDHDIPPFESAVGYGLIPLSLSSPTQEQSFDYMRARIQLAHIQASIYEGVYSVRATSQSSPDTCTENIHDLLRSWLLLIPAQLGPDRLSSLSEEDDIPSVVLKRQLISLYFSYVACFMHAHRVGTHEAEWIGRLAEYSQGLIVTNSSLSPRSSGWKAPASGWGDVVAAARDGARLMRAVERDDEGLVWNTTCTYISASLVLIANLLTISESTSSGYQEDTTGLDIDSQLVTECLSYLENAASRRPTTDEGIKRMFAAISELGCRARIARARFLVERGGQGQGQEKGEGVRWLEAEARKSAAWSARMLVEAFTGAGVKPLVTRVAGRRGTVGDGCLMST